MKSFLKCFILVLALMLLSSFQIVKADGGYVIPEKTVEHLISTLPKVNTAVAEKSCLKFVSDLWKKTSSNTPWPTNTFCCAYKHSLQYGISSTAKNGKLVTPPPIGAYVYYKDIEGSATSHNGHRCEHVALYIGNREVLHAFGGKVKKHNIENIPGYQLTSWAYPMGISVEYIDDPGFDLCIDLTSYPTKLTVGSSYGLKGTITSNYKIDKISAKVLSGSKVMASTEGAPNSYNINIADSVINKNIKFGSLPASNTSYTLVISAHDTNNRTKTVSKNFTIDFAVVKPLEIDLTSYPTKLTVGSSYGLKGTITSGYKIDKISAKILNGSKVMASTEQDTNSLNINIADSVINKNLKFASLPASDTPYTLVISAHDTSNKTITVSKNFVVTAININLTSIPGTLTKGKSFGLRGNITSVNTITKVCGAIKTTGGTTKFSSTDTPNAKSMDIRYSNLNNKLSFGRLPVGSYVLEIKAMDNKGNLQNAQYKFTVK